MFIKLKEVILRYSRVDRIFIHEDEEDGPEIWVATDLFHKDGTTEVASYHAITCNSLEEAEDILRKIYKAMTEHRNIDIDSFRSVSDFSFGRGET